MKKIAQTLTFLFTIALLGSSCNTLPEDPRTWNTPGTKTKKEGYYVQPKQLPVDNETGAPHPVRQDNLKNPNSNQQI